MCRVALLLFLATGTIVAEASTFQRLTRSSLAQKLLTVSLAATLVGSSMVSYSQPHIDEAFQPVTVESPIYQRAVVLLRTVSPVDDESDQASNYAFHLAYVGSDSAGDSLLIGRERPAGGSITEQLAMGGASLYGYDGLIAENIELVELERFADRVDGTFDVALYAVPGVDLGARGYQPIALAPFPFTEKTDTELLSYRFYHRPAIGDEEQAIIAEEGFTLHRRACESHPNLLLSNIGIGLTTCGNPQGSLAVGSLILAGEQAIAIQSSGRDADDLWWSSEFPTEAIDYLGNVPTAVSVNDKVTTTWAEIKSGR